MGVFLGAAALALAVSAPLNDDKAISGTPQNQIETGATDFIVLGAESLGLSAPPTDLHELPNGAMLVVSPEEIAIGDGIRWQAYRRAPTAPPLQLYQVAVTADGVIYAGMENGIARIELTDGGYWAPVRVATFPDDPALRDRILSRITAVAGQWIWHGVSGALVSWQPGKPVRLLGQVNSIECVFGVGEEIYVSDASSASTFRITDHTLEPAKFGPEDTLNELITTSAALGTDSTLLGTNALGVLIVKGGKFRALSAAGPLSGRYRINGLCAVTAGYYAAAVDSLGVAFFDQNGRLAVVMDRTLDHRLARVQQVFASRGGAVWALLTTGIARFALPAAATNFETKVSTGLAFSLLYRHQNILWLATDGLAQRGIYDSDQRLVRFEPDSPPGYVMSMFTAGDLLLAGTEKGIYRYSAGEWSLGAPGINKPHLCAEPTADGRYLYAAIDEIGWLRRTDTGIATDRHPWPGLGATFISVRKVGDVYWVELGSGRVARITVKSDGTPTARIFTTADGLTDSWVQIFVVDGIVRFNLSGRILRFDSTTDRFLPDTDFLKLTHDLSAEHGRPTRDSLGRLWLATRDGVHLIPPEPGNRTPVIVPLPPGILPILFTMQQDGVVWLHQRQRLIRYDPALPEIASAPLHALISSVQLAGSNRSFHFVSGSLPDLDYRENSLTLRFLAPGIDPVRGVTFEVMLQGGGGTWESVGAGGLASFTRLKEGKYSVLVRPRYSSTVGPTTTLAFVIRPPWYRTWLAYLIYAGLIIGTIAVIAGGWAYLERRKQRHLAELVEVRTRDLRQSEERYRHLTEELEQRVAIRTTALETANRELASTNRELESFSYSVSHDLRAPLRGIDGWSLALLEDYGSALDAPALGYLTRVRTETQRLGILIDDLLKLSRTTRSEFRPEPLNLSELAAGTARRVGEAQPDRKVEFIGQPGLLCRGDSALLELALYNLFDNAWKFTSKVEQPRVEFGVLRTPDGPTYYIRDNGAGFDMRHASKLFGVFQRMHTQQDFPGTGIGLANVQRIIHRHGGRIWAESQPGTQTTFFFTLAVNHAPKDSLNPTY